MERMRNLWATVALLDILELFNWGPPAPVLPAPGTCVPTGPGAAGAGAAAGAAGAARLPGLRPEPAHRRGGGRGARLEPAGRRRRGSGARKSQPHTRPCLARRAPSAFFPQRLGSASTWGGGGCSCRTSVAPSSGA